MADVDGWTVEGAYAHAEGSAGLDTYARDAEVAARHLTIEAEDRARGARTGFTLTTIPLTVIAALLRSAGWTVSEPGAPSVDALEREAADVHRMAAWERARAEKAEAELARVRPVVERLTHALRVIERSGASGASIRAQRPDGHSCSWCRGMWTPCPTEAARAGLTPSTGGTP